MNYKAVIFDLDGVLCHTDRYHYLAWKRMADERGLFFNEDMNERLRGVGRMKSLEIILEENRILMSEAEKESCAEKKNEIYRGLLAGLSPSDVSAEVLDSLSKIRARGMKMAVGSSSKNTKFILGRLDLNKFFDAVSDGTNIARAKPDPEVFIKAGEFLGVSPERCLVVEDGRAGIEAAIAAGMDSAAIGEGVKYRMATYDLDNLSDLLNILFKL